MAAFNGIHNTGVRAFTIDPLTLIIFSQIKCSLRRMARTAV